MRLNIIMKKSLYKLTHYIYILGDVQHNEQWLYIIILTDTSMR